MTIKPLVSNQKSGEKENHTIQESQNQNLVVSNVRSNHRNVLNKTNEGQSPQRHSDVFDDISRHRKSPHKSGGRSKRDHLYHHHKRDQRDREKVCSSPQYHQVLSNCNSPHSTMGISKSPKLGSGSTQTSNNNNIINLLEETFSGYNSGDEHLVSKENLLTPDEWKNRDDQFLKAMSERGFIIQDIVEDGACLFRAISLQIYGDQEMHEVIRQQTMDYIDQNREYYAHFVTEDINSYVKRKRSKDSHGNHIEIQAMSEIYNRSVELYCYQTTPINIFNSEQIKNGYDPLRLSYQRGSHYNAILDPYNATVGVGLGLADYKPESQTREAIKLSEQLEIEKTMFEDKLKTTDWEATNEAIEEQIARESYLQWCRENMHCDQKASSTNSTSSTVTSAEANSNQTTVYNHCGSSSSNSKEAMQFFSTNLSNIPNNNNNNPNNNSCGNNDAKNNSSTTSNNDEILDQNKKNSVSSTSKTICKDNQIMNNECYSKCDSDDTDCSTSSVDQYREKIVQSNIPKLKIPQNSRKLKRRRTNDDNKSINVNHLDCVSTKRNRQQLHDKRLPIHHNDQYKPIKTNDLTPKTNSSTSDLSSVSYLPGTSKQQSDEDSKPVSKFYQSLLESSYTDDGIGQLSENEMVLKAMQMSRIDFLDEQKRKFDESVNHVKRDDGGGIDEDSS